MSYLQSLQNLNTPAHGVAISGDPRAYTRAYLNTDGLGILDTKINNDNNLDIYSYDSNGIRQNTGINVNNNNIQFFTNGIKKVDINSNDIQIGDNLTNNQNLLGLTVNGSTSFNTYIPDYNLILKPSINTEISSLLPIEEIFLFGCDINPTNGVCVISTSATTAGRPIIFVSGQSNTTNYLTNWTTFTNTVIPINNVRSVVFSNNRWVICGMSTSTLQLFYTTDVTALTGWTQITGSPWTTTRKINRMKFINGQFITLDTASRYRVSNDAITWVEITVNATSYSLTDIDYSPELQRYVISTISGGILYYSGITLPTTGSNMFTFVSLMDSNANSIAWSSKLGMFLIVGSLAPFNRIFFSRDAEVWTSYTNQGTWGAARDTKWINDFGGFYITIPQQTNNNCAISRDGLTWSFLPLTFTNQGNTVLYNSISKIFILTGNNIAHFRNVSSIFSTFSDPDNVINTFNSNIIFNDTIEYKLQTFEASVTDNVVPISSLSKSVIELNTSNTNAGIYLQGISLNNRLGIKYKINKTISRNNNVLIYGYETCRLISPVIDVSNFNFTSTPNFYVLIPLGYYGSFDLTRVSNDNNGTWLIDNINIYDNNGVNYLNKSLVIDNNLTINGTFQLKQQYIPSILRVTTSILNINTDISLWVPFSIVLYNLTAIQNQTLNIANTLTLTNNFNLTLFIYGGSTQTNTINLSGSGWGAGQNVYNSNFSAISNIGTSTTFTEPGNAEIEFTYFYDSTTPSSSIWVVRRKN